MNRHTQTYHGNGKPESSKSPERLQHEVDETRNRIESRLDSLSHSLSPGELLDQALGMARRHGGEFGGNLGRQVKQNPLPLLLTGIGLSWLMMSRDNPYPASGESLSPGIGERASGAMHSAGDKARHAKERAGDMKGSMQQRAGEMKGAAQERAHSAASSLEHRARSGQQQLNEFFHDQPVVAGGLAIAIGAALGAMLPRSETEDRVMGDVSDETKAKAKEKGSEQYEKARERGSEAVQAADKSGNQSSPGASPGMSASSGSSSGSPRI